MWSKSKDGGTIKKVYCEARDKRSTLNRKPARLGVGCAALPWRQECLATYIKPAEMRQAVWKALKTDEKQRFLWMNEK